MLRHLFTQLLKPEMDQIFLKIIGHFRNQSVGQSKDLVRNVRCPTFISITVVYKATDFAASFGKIELSIC